MHKYIITGAPGTGKTSIINELKNRKYKIFEEVPRRLITENIPEKHGINPFINLKDFAKLVFDEMYKQYTVSEQENNICFFDRGLPDVFAYLLESNIDIPNNYYANYNKCNYNKTVFICPPWQSIYISDSIRPYNFAEIINLGNKITETYDSFGYNTLTLPLTSIKKRADIIINHIQNK
ncbi:MAG TPA: AAA family ATPase [Victivallales bacterium]|nr:AAA family ATPase [Victivallales bacterium]